MIKEVDELFKIVPHKNKYIITPEELHNFINNLNISSEDKEELDEILINEDIITLARFLNGVMNK